MPNQIHYIQNLSNCFKIHRTSEYVHHVNTQIIYINAFMHLFIHAVVYALWHYFGHLSIHNYKCINTLILIYFIYILISILILIYLYNMHLFVHAFMHLYIISLFLTIKQTFIQI